MAEADLLVVGGTGLAGRAVVAAAVARGLRVRVLSRRPPGPDAQGRITGAEYRAGDIRTGAGLREALTGARALIDTTNGFGRADRPTLTDGARRLTEAAAAAGVERAVVLSIVNVDRSSFGYYRAKAEQERLYLGAGLSARVVRATQFHDFVATFCHLAPFGLATAIRRVRFQPIAVEDVAVVLVDQALDPAAAPERTMVIGGPLAHTTGELAALWQKARGRRGPVIPVPLPGQLGRFFRAGLNLAPDHRAGTVTFEEWLAGH
ncbi:SDR family oxidoreductase [Cryobacterium tagatosivorans]|uniref:Epimerase n=1 Tax=Cryobacterium tagatosivorans TaxID=1259199 RepID=A0A4R8UEH8_9MICO|nr:NAD(P)H-binding protein [Cryobacterium tagatosivorans]TFB49534.1 epimerase [Cryobacterium tagatosivorans]